MGFGISWPPQSWNENREVCVLRWPILHPEFCFIAVWRAHLYGVYVLRKRLYLGCEVRQRCSYSPAIAACGPIFTARAVIMTALASLSSHWRTWRSMMRPWADKYTHRQYAATILPYDPDFLSDRTFYIVSTDYCCRRTTYRFFGCLCFWSSSSSQCGCSLSSCPKDVEL